MAGTRLSGDYRFCRCANELVNIPVFRARHSRFLRNDGLFAESIRSPANGGAVPEPPTLWLFITYSENRRNRHGYEEP